VRDGQVSKLSFRRRLRREQTDAERKVWALLRSRHFSAYKFRRQHSIGPYIADFVCLEKKLVIELDGWQHAENAEYDERRSAFLRSKGYRVIRIWDSDVYKQPEATKIMIWEALDSASEPRSVRAKVYGWKNGRPSLT
jgi:very-short-patch-repair endonuclease